MSVEANRARRSKGDSDVAALDAESVVLTQQAGLVRFAYLITGRVELAEDVVAEVFARAWPDLQRQRIRDPGAYLRRAIVNETVRRGRRARLERSLQLRPQAAGSVEREVAERDHLLRALSRLSPRQRAVVVLRYWEDLSEADTAAILGTSVGTVKTQAHRALIRLRQLLESER